jgi:rhamnose transport system ATP-binding protein
VVSQAVELVGISKSYAGVPALHETSLTLRAGTVHAFVGANGAGKSTCLRIIAGATRPDAGFVRISGVELPPGDTHATRVAGIAAIYQEPTLVPALTTQANIFLGREPTRAGFVREKMIRDLAREFGARVGVRVDTDVPVRALSLSRQRLVEVVRALAADARVMLFDEPTAALGPAERDAFYSLVSDLRSTGVTVLLVSHQLEDVLEVSDAITAFRDGRAIETRVRAEWTHAQLVDAIVGATTPTPSQAERERGSARTPQERSPGRSRLVVEDVSVGCLSAVSFEVRPGEIVGIAGLVGSGRSTLLRALAGDRRPRAGRLSVDGKRVSWPESVREARRHGLVLLSEDRRASGLFPDMTAMDNILISDFASAATAGLVRKEAARAVATAMATQVAFDPARLSDRAGALSGGNQQKLLLARWIHSRPAVLFADEPTRGVDVGARAAIDTTLKELAAGGAAVVVVSSELEELEPLCDRVLVLAGGRIVGELASDLSAATILDLLFAHVGTSQPTE